MTLRPPDSTPPTIPVVAANTAQPQHGPMIAGAAIASASAKILIVDDHQLNVTLLEVILGGAGYVCVTSTLDPRRVCDLHRENRYDLILLDLQMPVMDGFEVMAELSKIEDQGYLSVLVITAQPDHMLRALDAGAKDFVTKPFDRAEVLTRVRNLLEVRLYAKELALAVKELAESRDLIREKNAELERLFDQVVAERKVSERLALRAPPNSIAERLAERPDATAADYPDVTVLIADVVGLAERAPSESPARLAVQLEDIFTLFDEVAGTSGLKKIKTLGNSYLAMSGAPVASPDHAARAARTALDMIDGLEQWNRRAGARLQVRIGLHSGAVNAGVIGRRHFVYDVWGDAVNIATRMESHGVAGRVQVSETTQRRLSPPFVLEERGVLQIDGEPALKTWFLTGGADVPIEKPV